jgi:hypothetical protein
MRFTMYPTNSIFRVLYLLLQSLLPSLRRPVPSLLSQLLVSDMLLLTGLLRVQGQRAGLDLCLGGCEQAKLLSLEETSCAMQVLQHLAGLSLLAEILQKLT